MATMVEAKPFVLGMSLTEYGKRPFPIFKNENLLLVISGIGKANAAMASACCCNEFKPSCVFNLGAAGASGFSHPLGDIYHIDKIVEYDRPKLTTNEPTTHKPDVLDPFRTATLSTSDRAIKDPGERQKISLFADLIDMEGASAVQACRIFGIKCYVFKFVSDTPEHTEDGDIIKNIRTYRASLFEFFLNSVLDRVK
jgi:nucleoside phosphorylase